MTTQTIERSITAFLDGEDSLSIPNIIHSTEGAAKFGFSGALVGGVTVYSWAVPALIDGLGEDWLDSGWIDFRLRRPVYPGDEITTRVVSSSPTQQADADSSPPLPSLGKDADSSPTSPSLGRDADSSPTLPPLGKDADSSPPLPPLGGDAEGRGGTPTVEFTMTKESGDVCIVGSAGIGEADFYQDLAVAQNRAVVPAADPPTLLTRDNLPVGEDLPAMSVPISVAEAADYADHFARDPHPRWRGTDARLHPGWIAGRCTRLIRHTYTYRAGIHAGSQIQVLAPILAGQTLVISGHMTDGYRRKRHEYCLLDVTISSESGEDLARLRHRTIYQVGGSD